MSKTEMKLNVNLNQFQLKFMKNWVRQRKKNVYEIITDKFIDKLKEGTIPWQKPFYSSSNVPVRWESQKAYRGVNVLLLEPNGEYASMKVIRKHKGWVKKEELKNYSISV